MVARRLFLSVLVAVIALTVVAADKITSTLPSKSERLEGYADRNEVKSRLTNSGMHFIEGLWSFPADGAEFAIERIPSTASVAPARYRIVAICLPDRSIRPGTVIGIISPGAGGEYDAALYTSVNGKGLLKSPKHFTLKLRDENSSITFTRVKSRFNLEFYRLLPYMFRRVIRSRYGDDGSANATAVRVFPEPTIPFSPRYL